MQDKRDKYDWTSICIFCKYLPSHTKNLVKYDFCSVLIYIKPLHNRFKFIHDSKLTTCYQKTIILSSFLGIFFKSEEDLIIASFDIFIFRTHKGTVSVFAGKMSDLTKILTESQGKH